ncbi:MAG: hypothetical protein GY953_27280 [bacterium]|nr:hypothetical protein [bacterium]
MEALRQAREWMMLAAARIAGVKGSLDNLRQSQARRGLGLRSDITASERRLEFYMDEAESALGTNDPDKAKKNLDSAERELQKLERFLGR